MEQIVQNLSAKNIKDFTPEDTIYLRDTSNPSFPVVFLCQFISVVDGKRGGPHINGRMLQALTNPSNYKFDIDAGKTLTVSLKNAALYGSPPESEQTFFHWFNSGGYALDPLAEYKVMEDNTLYLKRHPSFGMIYAGRVTHGAKVPLFGTSIQAGTTIQLRISRGEHRRDLSNDWYHAQDEIVEVEMSTGQWAEFITHLNTGSGTPCTIRHVDHKPVAEPPFISKADVFQKEFSNSMHNYAVDIEIAVSSIWAMLDHKATITKADREVIKQSINRLLSQIKSTVPFIAEQFQKSMEHTVVEAKQEIDNFIQSKIHTAGLATLLQQSGILPQLPETSMEPITAEEQNT